jgi:predicted RNA polymerase sigma factor
VTDADTHRAVEIAARESYGRLVAWLTSRCRDVRMAEDAVADALEAALRQWPERGVPRKPEAWLLTTARRRVIDRQRRDRTVQDHVGRLQREAQEAADRPFLEGLPERRLELMLLCAHPEIPEDLRTPLMLQTVLGLDAQRIGSAMLVKPATMGQRLSRGKRRIKERGLAFETPSPEVLPERIGFLLEAIYGAYGAGWERSSTGLATEAIWLAQLLVRLAPDFAEPYGLLALMLYAEARRPARRTADGAFVPLEEQDTSLWDHALILEAEKALWIAGKKRTPGPFQLEAAIQSLHVHRARSGHTDWRGIRQLYEALDRRWPSLGVAVGLAAASARDGALEEGLARLDALDPPSVARHQPYWAVRAHLLKELGRPDAGAAYERAIGLTEDPALRAWLASQRP